MDLAGRDCGAADLSADLLWLVKHDFPFLELMRNIRESGRDVARGPIAFIADQALIMNPLLFPLWVGGLVWLFFGRVEKQQSDGEGLTSTASLRWAVTASLVGHTLSCWRHSLC